jgi:hypothetical protein
MKKSNLGDGVPLITARAGLMTPTGSIGRWVPAREVRRRFFSTLTRRRFLQVSILIMGCSES